MKEQTEQFEEQIIGVIESCSSLINKGECIPNIIDMGIKEEIDGKLQTKLLQISCTNLDVIKYCIKNKRYLNKGAKIKAMGSGVRLGMWNYLYVTKNNGIKVIK